jgi:hypothetical protein
MPPGGERRVVRRRESRRGAGGHEHARLIERRFGRAPMAAPSGR